MTYGELKNTVTALLFGDVKTPEDEYFVPLVSQALVYIAYKYDILGYITNDQSKNILRDIGGNYFIRRPNAPTGSISEVIDIEGDLNYALSNLVASYISRENKSYYFDLSMQFLDMYSSKNDNTEL